MSDHHALSVVQRVRALEPAREFLQHNLGMALRDRSDTFALLDNGSLCVRLVQDAISSSRLAIEVVSREPSETLDALAGVARVIEPLRWVSADRQEARLAVDDWLELVVSRKYDEDELGIVPELPVTIPWHTDASRLLRELLREVPVAFRPDARIKVVRRAEELTVEERADLSVDITIAVRALLEKTPSFQHERLLGVLALHGIRKAD